MATLCTNQGKTCSEYLLPGFKSLVCLIIICSFLFTSCARYYYAPNSVNIPLLSEKEAKINVQYATGSVSEAFECQSAFAVSKHFGGMINTMLGSSKNDYDLSTANTNLSYIDIGAGYFTPINSTSFIFEAYGGIGTGGVRNDYAPGNSRVHFTKLFLQPNIGIKVKGFELAFSPRLSWVKHNVVSYSDGMDNYDFQFLDYLSNHPYSFLIEPGAVIRAGGKNFMAQLQYTGSINLTHPDNQYKQEQGYFAIGFSIPIHYKTAGQ